MEMIENNSYRINWWLLKLISDLCLTSSWPDLLNLHPVGKHIFLLECCLYAVDLSNWVNKCFQGELVIKFTLHSYTLLLVYKYKTYMLWCTHSDMETRRRDKPHYLSVFCLVFINVLNPARPKVYILCCIWF